MFDPDSYVNLSDEKEEEFRKIHEAYKSLVDFMLSSFMDDLQVTPEQVEEACQQREKQSTVADSHITKVSLNTRFLSWDLKEYNVKRNFVKCTYSYMSEGCFGTTASGRGL